MSTTTRKVQLTVSLEPDQVKQIDELAAQQYTKRGTIIRQAVALFLTENTTDRTNTNGASHD